MKTLARLTVIIVVLLLLLNFIFSLAFTTSLFEDFTTNGFIEGASTAVSKISFLARSVIPGTYEHNLVNDKEQNLLSPFQDDDHLFGMADLHPFIISYNRGEFDFNSWDWRVHPVFGYVVGADSETGIVGLRIDVPGDRGFSGKNSIVNVNCASDQTLILSKSNLDVLSENVSFFQNAKPGDGLYSFCEDSSCSVIGKLCALVDLEAYETSQ